MLTFSQVYQKTEPFLRKAKRSDAGAVVLKFRLASTGDEEWRSKRPPEICSIAAHPSTLPITNPCGPLRTPLYDGLARALIQAMETDGTGYSISDFGYFMHSVPFRVGHNAALDAAVACLLRTRSDLVSNRSLSNSQTPRYYLTAVQRLQQSLEDRVEGMSSNTLCAAVILSLVEVSKLNRTCMPF